MPQDDYGFWQADRDRSLTGPIPRLSRTPRQPASRKHGRDEFDDCFSSQMWATPDIDDELGNDHAWAGSVPIVGRSTGRPPNFVLRRIGALVALGLVAAPIALLIGGREDGGPRVGPADSPIVEQIIQPGSTLAVDALPVTIAAPGPATLAQHTAVPSTVPAAAVTQKSTAPTSVTQPPTTPATATTQPANALVAETTPTSQARAETTASSTFPTASDNVASQAASVDQTVAVERTCANNYEVVAGDYWILIAARVSVPLADVLEANDATVDTPLFPDSTVCLPTNASAPTTVAPATTAATATTVKATTTTVMATTTTATTVAPPATTAAPSTTAPPPKNTYTRAEVEQIIRDVWPDDLEDEAIRIATRESNLIPTVRNYCCFGLFQLYWNVHKSWMASAGVTSSAQLYDPLVNAYLAYSMYLRSGGWGPWR